MATQHTVKSGDTLSKLALQYYGNVNAWGEIAVANAITNPNLIQPGQVLTIPDPSPAGIPKGPSARRGPAQIDVTVTPEGTEEVTVSAPRTFPQGLILAGGALALFMLAQPTRRRSTRKRRRR